MAPGRRPCVRRPGRARGARLRGALVLGALRPRAVSALRRDPDRRLACSGRQRHREHLGGRGGRRRGRRGGPGAEVPRALPPRRRRQPLARGPGLRPPLRAHGRLSRCARRRRGPGPARTSRPRRARAPHVGPVGAAGSRRASLLRARRTHRARPGTARSGAAPDARGGRRPRHGPRRHQGVGPRVRQHLSRPGELHQQPSHARIRRRRLRRRRQRPPHRCVDPVRRRGRRGGRRARASRGGRGPRMRPGRREHARLPPGRVPGTRPRPARVAESYRPTPVVQPVRSPILRSANRAASARNARPRCDTASFSTAVISAKVRPSPPSPPSPPFPPSSSPSGTNKGS